MTSCWVGIVSSYVLVCLDSSTSVMYWVDYRLQKLISHGYGGWNLNSEHQYGGSLMRPSSWLMGRTSQFLYRIQEVRELFEVWLVRALMLFMRTPFPIISSPPKGLHWLLSSFWGIEISQCKFEGKNSTEVVDHVRLGNWSCPLSVEE